MNTITNHTFWKTAENGLLAHLYEHLITQEIDEQMQAQGYLLVTDYSMWGKTYGTTCFIDFSARNEAVANDFASTIQGLQGMSFSRDAVRVASLECACEYARPLMKLDEDMLLDSIVKMHNQPWKPISEFFAQQAVDSTSVNTLFELPSIRYGRRRRTSFSSVIAQYTISPHSYVDKPELKALSAILIQSLALNFNAYLKNIYVYYDAGDHWTGRAISTEYETMFVFPKKDAPLEGQLLSHFYQYIARVQRSNFLAKLTDMLHNGYAFDPSVAYFDQDTLNRITGGVVMGGLGWKEVGNLEVIRNTLNSVRVSFYKVE